MALTPRDSYLRRTYGLTEAQYREILEAQGGTCAVCGKDPGERNLNVDHDHRTGRVRGLLCTACNYDLIAQRRDPGIFEAAAWYLTQPFLAEGVLGPDHKVPSRPARRRRKRVRA